MVDCYDAPKVFQKEELEKLHTKVLLKWNYRSGDSFYQEWLCEGCKNLSKCLQIQKNNKILVKEILATRPHILNKQEGKVLRRKLAKQKT